MKTLDKFIHSRLTTYSFWDDNPDIAHFRTQISSEIAKKFGLPLENVLKSTANMGKKFESAFKGQINKNDLIDEIGDRMEKSQYKKDRNRMGSFSQGREMTEIMDALEKYFPNIPVRDSGDDTIEVRRIPYQFSFEPGRYQVIRAIGMGKLISFDLSEDDGAIQAVCAIVEDLLLEGN